MSSKSCSCSWSFLSLHDLFFRKFLAIIKEILSSLQLPLDCKYIYMRQGSILHFLTQIVKQSFLWEAGALSKLSKVWIIFVFIDMLEDIELSKVFVISSHMPKCSHLSQILNALMFQKLDIQFFIKERINQRFKFIKFYLGYWRKWYLWQPLFASYCLCFIFAKCGLF